MISGTAGEDDKFKSVGLTTPTSYAVYSNTAKYDINTVEGANRWKAFCDLTGGDNTFGEVLAFHVKYLNAIERYDHFSHVSYADNRIPEREYITAFKPLYNELIPVYSGPNSSYTYVINLAEAFTNGTFEGVLTYNTGKTASLDDLSKIQFRTDGLSAPVTAVSWENGILKVTVDNPGALAGSSLGLDVGYSDAASFTEYDTNNTDMVRGTLNLTFGELKANRVKKLTLKNDVANRSYFLETDNTTKDSSVAVLYTQDADDAANITKSMQNPAQTDTLTPMDDYVLSYWYLLSADGRPVTDKNGDVIRFADENEIKAYMFSGTWPSYLTTDGLVPDTLTNPASVENLNSFTFQAEVLKKPNRAALMNVSDENGSTTGEPLRRVISSIVSTAHNNDDGLHKITAIIKLPGGTSDTNLTAWKTAEHRGFLSRSMLASVDGVRPTPVQQSYLYDTDSKKYVLKTQNNLDKDYIDPDYPLPIYAYAVMNGSDTYNWTLYYFSDDPNPMLVGSAYALFHWQPWRLTDISGLADWDTSELTSAKQMFDRMQVPNADNPNSANNWVHTIETYDFSKWDLSGCTASDSLNDMFKSTNLTNKTIEFADGTYYINNDGKAIKQN